ncbi:DUF5130 family protein [Enemella sp. A6]|uniref:DUF5130 family protein n=1 Tax=Enemella sp. A6 TaxID=3440152 RepID=UPI003EBD0CFB
MTGGEILNANDREAIEDALAQAREVSGYTFNVSLDRIIEDPRTRAVALHAATVDPDNTVLIAVDPVGRSLEIVTGAATQRTLQDSECKFAAATMVTSFRHGDLAGGLVQGIGQLAEAARSLRVLHARDVAEL